MEANACSSDAPRHSRRTRGRSPETKIIDVPMAMTPTELAARYREYAAKCVLLAQSQENANERLGLIDMAQAWIALAEQAEKNEALFVVHETSDT